MMVMIIIAIIDSWCTTPTFTPCFHSLNFFFYQLRFVFLLLVLWLATRESHKNCTDAESIETESRRRQGNNESNFQKSRSSFSPTIFSSCLSYHYCTCIFVMVYANETNFPHVVSTCKKGKKQTNPDKWLDNERTMRRQKFHMFLFIQEKRICLNQE